MRRLVLVSVLCLPGMAIAQNYVPAERYNNPDIVVNLDVLAGSGVSPAPVYREHLPAPRPPVVLTPPRPHMPPMAALPIEEKPSASRQLLAQARAQAAEEEKEPEAKVASSDRSPILFDNPSAQPAPSMPVVADAPVKEELTMPPAMPMALTPPSDDEMLPAPATSPETVVATSSQPAEQDNFEAYRLFFEANAPDRKSNEQGVLHTIIAKLKRDENIHAQILAYAGGTPDTVSQARRLSLTRALAVRTAMLNDGITADRLNVRAMGMGDPGMADRKLPPDRVDIVFEK